MAILRLKSKFYVKISHYLCHSYGTRFSHFSIENLNFTSKLVIICATRVEPDFCILAFEICTLRQKLVIIFATRAVANFIVLALNSTPLFDRMHKTFFQPPERKTEGRVREE